MSDDLKWVYSLKTIAVVGASQDEKKPAHYVPAYLKEKGYTIIPVNPYASEIFGETCYKTLTDIPGAVDIVLMFRPSEEVPALLPDIVQVNPKVLWMQLGIKNEEVKHEAERHGIYVVMNKCMMQEHKQLSGDYLYDVVIIGGGPAGLSAGIYAARARLKTVILEVLMPGGQAAVTDFIENYPGFPEGISGPGLIEKMQEQAEKFGCKITSGEAVNVDFKEKKVFTPTKVYEWKALIIATGAEPKSLEVPGEDAFMGRGVSFCATCDGALFAGRTVSVVGGGDSALKEALFLTKFASKVHVIHRRDQLRAEKIMQEQAFENSKIEFVWDTVVTEIFGENRVQGVRVKNVKTGKESTLSVDGVFVYIGRVPNTSLFEVEKDAEGYIVTDENMHTSITGVVAAGDCRSKHHRQVATAVGDGVAAAMSAGEYVAGLRRYI